MNALTDTNLLQEVECGENFEYVLDDNAYFLNTDYRVLQSQKSDVFIQCMKITRNGKISLYYLTEQCRTLSSLFSMMTEPQFIQIFSNLLMNVVEVKNNGFLSYQNIDLSWEKVFIDSITQKVKFIYFPLDIKSFENFTEFEYSLRCKIANLANTLFLNENFNLKLFVEDLTNRMLPLTEVCNRAQNMKSAANSPIVAPTLEPVSGANVEKKSIRLVAMNASEHFEIEIDRDEMVLGRKRDVVDGWIPFNKAIGRTHCRIVKENSSYYIIDENSANGTYVNRKKLAPGQKTLIQERDVIRLANSDFQVV